MAQMAKGWTHYAYRTQQQVDAQMGNPSAKAYIAAVPVCLRADAIV